jgi:hypothetical protein
VVTPTHRASLVLLAVSLATYGYFHMPAAWNETSRYSLVRAVVERGAFDIDPYHEVTGDKSFRGGHYYSDKAPGAALFAVPAYAVYYALRSATGQSLPAQRQTGDPDQPVEVNRAYLRGMYVTSLFSVGLLAILALFAFHRLAARIAPDPRAALLATVAFGFGTLTFPYATLFYGHHLCGSLLFLAFALLAPLRPEPPRAGLVALAGFAAGGAVVAEYPAAVAVLLLGVYLVCRRGWRIAGWFAAGGLVPALVLAGYHAVCFGAPWQTGYGFVADGTFAAGMSEGLLGVTYPRPGVVLEILFGTYRGYALLSPIVFIGAWGIVRLYRTGHRAEALLATAIVVFYVLLNASYYMWWGGSSLGARHTIPMLPFLLFPLARVGPGRVRTAAWVLLAYSVVTMLVATAVSPEPPESLDPVLAFHWGHFLDGNLAVNPGSTNLGLLLGLPGLWSLVPLLMVWAVAATCLARSQRLPNAVA